MENSDALVQMALKALTPEQQEEYKKIGEHMYKDLSAFTGNAKNDKKDGNNNSVEIDDNFKESVAYIESGIRSGLLVSDLEDEEIEVLKTVYGETWYKKYGYEEKDFKK